MIFISNFLFSHVTYAMVYLSFMFARGFIYLLCSDLITSNIVKKNPYATHGFFLNLFLRCIILVTMGFALIILTLLDEEELGPDGFHSTLIYQFISGSVFILFLLLFVYLAIVIQIF